MPALPIPAAQYRAARDSCRRLSPDLYLAAHVLGKPLRCGVFAVAALAGQLAEIIAGGPCGEAEPPPSCSPAGCASCGPETLAQRRAVCSAVIAHLFAARPTGQPALDAFPAIAAAYGLQPEPFEQLADGLATEAQLRRYPTWRRLREMLEPTAAAPIALTLLAPAGAPLPSAAQAVALGVALRLTHLLGRVERDWAAGRVMLPLDDLMRFGLSERDLASFAAARSTGGDPRWRDLMAFEVQRTLRLLDGSEGCLAALTPQGRRAAAVLIECCRRRLRRLTSARFDALAPAADAEPGWLPRLRELPAAVALLRRRPVKGGRASA